ncbi:hypothetical protein [Breoghania sp.]|uniref:hypothetical protein n=1 Tax=Breoghania sp. TaxID=2065378 RepID=UPI00260870A4|nr:hypothetical protein [Breoghania sp.]MDJ0930133.1 hypothetical protein [Breoghania sp.]
MPLQNRVTPEGEIIAASARKLFTGNRGGRIHDPATRTLTVRRFISRRSICCLTTFKNRKRTVMGEGYTELFFLDEPTALAAGHRPCFECRRVDAKAFAAFWCEAKGLEQAPGADAMDAILHKERLGPKPSLPIVDLCDGTAILTDIRGKLHPALVRGNSLLPWAPGGYGQPSPHPAWGEVTVLTPLSILAVLRAGL